jgi:hypothetical protein
MFQRVSVQGISDERSYESLLRSPPIFKKFNALRQNPTPNRYDSDRYESPMLGVDLVE